jgi:hypothetical protein
MASDVLFVQTDKCRLVTTIWQRQTLNLPHKQTDGTQQRLQQAQGEKLAGSAQTATNGLRYLVPALKETDVQFVRDTKYWLVTTIWQRQTLNLPHKQTDGTQQQLQQAQREKLSGSAN